MSPTPNEILARFACSLSCAYQTGELKPVAPSASTLPYILSSDADADRSCTFPCLSLKISRGFKVQTLKHASQENPVTAEAQILGRVVHMGKNNIVVCPSLLLQNFLSSFGHLLRVRLQQTLFQLIERREEVGRVQSKEDAKTSISRQRLLLVLTELSRSNAPPICPVVTAINFRTLDVSCGTSSRQSRFGTKRVVRPLEFEASLNIEILQKEVVTVVVQAPGTIAGVFCNQNSRPDNVDVRVDMDILLNSMKRQCRHVVDRALAAASEGEINWRCIKPNKRTRSVSASPETRSRPRSSATMSPYSSTTKVAYRHGSD